MAVAHVDRPQRRFALRFAVFGVLLFSLYTFPYEEYGMSETWFTAYLAGYARMAGGALALLEPGIRVSGQDIFGRFGLRIVKSCDAMEAVLLFAAAVLAFPAAWRTRALGIALGVGVLVGLNVVRICTLYYVGVYRPAQFELYHMEVWPLALVSAAGLAFIVWSSWVTRQHR